MCVQANAGLKVVRDLLEPIKAKYPGLSYSDLWTLAGVVAIQEMGGPQIPWRSGRLDALAENCVGLLFHLRLSKYGG
jgi:cytochrome c peroxidase